MKITDQQYWDLSRSIYRDKYMKIGRAILLDDGSEWSVIDFKSTSNGYQGIAVVPSADYLVASKIKDFAYPNIVVASRGTEPTAWDHDIITDIKYVVGAANPGKKTNQFKDALDFFDTVQAKFSPSNTYVTGHSLGGGIAQYLVAERSTTGVTFAAPNIYRILSPEAKKAVEQGKTVNQVLDYTHSGEMIGEFSQFGAPLIGRELIAKGSGYGLENFKPYFSANGSATLKVTPSAIKAEADRLTVVLAQLEHLEKTMHFYQEEERASSQRLGNELNNETSAGGSLSELTSREVDDILTRHSQKYENGVYCFHKPDKFEELYEMIYRVKKRISEFRLQLGSAADRFQQQDVELGNWIENNSKGLF
ncbi:DUF6792 domain-containing protein [Listeria booriae]|uniref:DUF6792 domain-containing protein n=1 Tax=Listeria booriae TaxID=1552123 RepID=UPI00162612DF|nr:DUF6792 domain-containing protein [Listeria booriae]MBC1513232.1 hypothetical protein [Listeria booriae]